MMKPPDPTAGRSAAAAEWRARAEPSPAGDVEAATGAGPVPTGTGSQTGPAPSPAPTPTVAECLADPTRWGQRTVMVNGIESLRAMAGTREALGVIQLEPGRVQGEFMGFGLGAVRVTLGRLSHAIRVWDRTGPGWRDFVLVRQMAGFGSLGGKSFRPGDLVDFPPGRVYDASTPRDYLWASVRIHPQLVADALEQRTGSPGEVPTAVETMRMGPQNYLRLERLCETLLGLRHRTLTPAALATHAASWVDLVADALVSGTPPPDPTTKRALASHRVLATAETFLRENLDDTLYMSAVGQAAGASERNLQHLFRQHFGTSPIAYLGILRMHRVRDALCAARGTQGAQVGRIARTWVRGHLGRFARGYRELFGESPSETLKGSKAPEEAARRPSPPSTLFRFSPRLASPEGASSLPTASPATDAAAPATKPPAPRRRGARRGAGGPRAQDGPAPSPRD